jgi:hypothetical protein
MVSKADYGGPDEELVLYETPVVTDPLIERQDAKSPFTSHSEHMFGLLDGEVSMALRLPPSSEIRVSRCSIRAALSNMVGS